MKKLLYTLTIFVFAINSNAFEINTDRSVQSTASNSATIYSSVHQSGSVDSNFGVRHFSVHGTAKVGSESNGAYSWNHAAVFTFDTSVVPPDAQVNYVLFHVEITEEGHGTPSYDYIFNHLDIEFSGPFGFGGSHVITGFDYYAAASGSYHSTIANGAVGGLMLNLDVNQNQRDLNAHINRYGSTQVRFKVKNNPDKKLFHFSGTDVFQPGNHVVLYIGWE